jgi:hypothetical protein
MFGYVRSGLFWVGSFTFFLFGLVFFALFLLGWQRSVLLGWVCLG